MKPWEFYSVTDLLDKSYDTSALRAQSDDVQTDVWSVVTGNMNSYVWDGEETETQRRDTHILAVQCEKKHTISPGTSVQGASN